MNISRRDVAKNGVWASPAILAAVNVPVAQASTAVTFAATQPSYNFKDHGWVTFDLKNVKSLSALAGHTFTVTSNDASSRLCGAGDQGLECTPEVIEGSTTLPSMTYTTDENGHILVGWVRGTNDRRQILHAVGTVHGIRYEAVLHITILR